jgi:anti-sigma factor RsiW
MNCLEVREHLTEYSLGMLGADEARRIERHLEWCEGCRREGAELQEGLMPLAASLPQVDPPLQLEERIVTRVLEATGRWKTTSRRGVRALVASTLAAVMVALGALGWGVAERQKAVDVKLQAADQLAQARRIVRVLQSVGATPYFAALRPTSQSSEASGTVLVYSGREVEDFVLAQLVLPPGKGSEYSFQLTDRIGEVLSGGKLTKTNNANTWIFLDRTERNLSRGIGVLVLDSSGSAVLTGVMKPAPASSSP